MKIYTEFYDIDTRIFLDTIFEEYKARDIKEGHQRKVVEDRLEIVRDEMEQAIKDATDDFIGRPNNDATRVALRDIINQHLNQFLDTDVQIESIEQDREKIEVNLSYRQKIDVSGISVRGGVTALSGNPAQDIISLQL